MIAASGLIVAAAGMSFAKATPPSSTELIEFTPWLIREVGPATAKGVVYFIRGWSVGLGLDDFRLTPYATQSLATGGWDVIGAKYPNRSIGPHDNYASVPAAAEFVRARAAALKAQGYKRVIVAGQSWGAWVAVAAAQAEDFAADALWLTVPNIYGPRITEHGAVNREFPLNRTKFAALLPNLRTPAILETFAGDKWDPGNLATLVRSHYQSLSRPDFVIDKPGGFVGHFSGWLPVYDYAFGQCIEAFLEQPQALACRPRPLSNDDFRSIVKLSQVADAGSRRISSAQPLIGKKFVAFNLAYPKRPYHYLYNYETAGERSTMSPFAETSEAVSFRDGQHCVAGTCTLLIQWSQRQILEFDPSSGNLRAWWTQL
jgi:pimeloyl-ACP methyl ester carboxylesterase